MTYDAFFVAVFGPIVGAEDLLMECGGTSPHHIEAWVSRCVCKAQKRGLGATFSEVNMYSMLAVKEIGDAVRGGKCKEVCCG